MALPKRVVNRDAKNIHGTGDETSDNDQQDAIERIDEVLYAILKVTDTATLVLSNEYWCLLFTQVAACF